MATKKESATKKKEKEPEKAPVTMTKEEHKAKMAKLVRMLASSDKAEVEKAKAEIEELNQIVFDKRIV